MIETQAYLDQDGTFTVECPFCFAPCYCHEDGRVECEEHEEHVFNLSC